MSRASIPCNTSCCWEKLRPNGMPRSRDAKTTSWLFASSVQLGDSNPASVKEQARNHGVSHCWASLANHFHAICPTGPTGSLSDPGGAGEPQTTLEEGQRGSDFCCSPSVGIQPGATCAPSTFVRTRGGPARHWKDFSPTTATTGRSGTVGLVPPISSWALDLLLVVCGASSSAEA